MPEAMLYVGCKIIRAYEAARDGQDGYAVIYPDGYESWSPKATFETAYRLVTEQEKRLID